MATQWDPAQYLKYGGERERPFADLLARVLHPSPEQVVDLGCGPGTTTAQLLDRWPEAHVVGIDSSPEMITRAQDLSVPGRLEFRLGDLRDWHADRPVDVLLCCATLQWVDDHGPLLQQFVGALSPGGVFAFQVPGNFGEPSHTLLYELATSERWSDQLAELVRPDPVLQPKEYLAILLATGARTDVWETTYLHVFEAPDAVLEWIRGTGLRPFLAALDQTGETEEFLATYASILRAAYPRDTHGRTIFPFRRIFGVTTK